MMMIILINIKELTYKIFEGSFRYFNFSGAVKLGADNNANEVSTLSNRGYRSGGSDITFATRP